MTVSTTVSKVIYEGDGVTSVFPVSFPIYSSSELEVQLENVATHVFTTLILSTNYTVALSSPADLPSTSTVTLIGGNSPLGVGYQLVIRRILPFTQLIGLINNERTPAGVLEEGYDRAIMLLQQLKEELERAFLQSITSDTALNIPTPITDYFLQALSTTTVGWVSAITSVTYAGTITRGLDAGKSLTPGVGDIYIATDTGRMYVANSINVWSQISFTANGMSLEVAQGAHGLSVNNVLKYSGGLYQKAKADTEANSRVVGVVTAVADANNFTLFIGGYASTLSGLTTGIQYYLSPSTAGLLTSTATTTPGEFVKPILIATSATAGFIFIQKSTVIETPPVIPTGFSSGMILPWGGTIATVPSGFLYCDGTAVSRVTYAALFTAIGTTHGIGNGVTTFNLPNTVNRFLYGSSTGVAAGNSDPGSAKDRTLSGNDSLVALNTTNSPMAVAGADNSAVVSFDVMAPYLSVPFMIKT